MDKKKLAILGLGNETTLFYISELNRIFNKKNGGYSTCPFILWNTNFNTINSLLPTISTEINRITQHCIQEIEKLEIVHILIPNITLHESIDQIEVKKNIIHPVYLTAEKIKESGVSKIILMGSVHTMHSTYISSIFNSKNIEVEIPSEKDKVQIDEFRKQVYAKKETKESVANYHEIIKKYTAKTLVVLACTELSIFKPKQHKNLLDMVQIQITEAINKI